MNPITGNLCTFPTAGDYVAYGVELDRAQYLALVTGSKEGVSVQFTWPFTVRSLSPSPYDSPPDLVEISRKICELLFIVLGVPYPDIEIRPNTRPPGDE